MPMKKHPLTLCLFVLAVSAIAFNVAVAQVPNAAPKKEFSYEMVSQEGTNATGVVWDSKHEVYITVIAGNSDFPREVFDGNGADITQTTCGLDWRGLWYNPSNGKCEGNAAGDIGWGTFGLDESNNPGEVTLFKEGQFQPDFQSVGAYDFQKKQVVFLDFTIDGLAMYSRKNPKKVKQLPFDWGKIDLGNINSTSVAFTGKKGFEFVVLDFVDGNLVFFDREGKNTATVQLPKDAPLNDSFAFSFTNDRAFLYDKTARVWSAYPIF
jgi:hypothetical protein